MIANYILDNAGNISKSSIGNTGVSQQLLYTTLIVAGIGLLVLGFIPGVNNIYSLLNSRVTLMSTILLVVSTYISTITTEKSNNLSTVGESFQIVDRCKGNFIQVISSYASACPRLINSFYYPFHRDSTYKKLDETYPDSYTAVNVVCTTLYQNVEDFLNTLTYTAVGNSEILTHFASMFVSPIVQQHWSVNSAGYQYCTFQLITNLITIVNTYTFTTPQELETFFIVYSTSSTTFQNILNNTLLLY